MNLSDKRLLVTGITGTLGERVAKRFVEECAEVKGLIRDEKHINRLNDLGITPVIGELSNRDSLIEVTKNIDIVIHCAAYLGGDWEQARNSNIVGVENLASLSLEAGVLKFIHISTTSVYGHPTVGHLDETSPIIEKHEAAYPETKAESERILDRYKDKGLCVTTLRPGAICAEENSYWGDRQVLRMLNTEVVNWVHPDDLVPWIHADNLVEMIYLVTLKEVCGQVYNAIDGNFPEHQFRVRLISALGKKLMVPDRPSERPVYSNTKVIELGYKPIRTFKETVAKLEKLGISQLKKMGQAE
jgi:nucleoside-diphosphate-sugar epimerase